MHLHLSSAVSFHFQFSRPSIVSELRLQAAAAVSVGTYWTWEPIATLQAQSAQWHEALWTLVLTEGGEGWGHIVVAARLQLV